MGVVDRDHLEELAYHYGQARDPQGARWYLRASLSAIASLDVGASAHADRGLALLDLVDPADPGLGCDLLIARATAIRLTGAETIDDARLAFDAAAKLRDQERMGRALLSVSLRSAAASQTEHLAFLSEGLRHLDDSTLITRWNAEVALVVHGEAAECGHHDEVRSLLDHLAPNGYSAVGRGWLTLMALGNVAWAAISVGATHHAAALRPMLDDYSGQIAVMATGTHALCAVDRLRAGLAELDGDAVEADRLFANALAQDRALRSGPLEARTLHWWGRALRHRGDKERASELLAQARTMAEGLSMRAVVDQIDELART